MTLGIISVYQDVRDNVNSNENGDLTYALFNRMSRRAELRLIDYLSGDVENIKPPIPDLSQKNRDWLSLFVVAKKTQVQNGKVVWPSDYYKWDNAFLLGKFDSDGLQCGPDPNDEDNDDCNTPIKLKSRQQFYQLCQSHIEGKRPSFQNPIAKSVGKTFIFSPKDLGSITLEYIRYPKFGKIVPMTDPVMNDEIADPVASQNYEWDEFARELLVWFITDTFAIYTREQALKQQNALTGKSVRDNKQ